MFYRVNAGFDMLPSSSADLLSEYRVYNLGGTSDGDEIDRQDNYINQQTYVHAGRLYFSGRLHLQTGADSSSDEGAMSGVFSIDSRGQLVPEVFESDNNDEFSWEQIQSFAIVGSGFVISGGGDTWMTEYDFNIDPATQTDVTSGVITKIINGSKPWENKKLESIFVGIDDASLVKKIELYTRELQNIHTDSDAGWEKVYEGPVTDTKFGNRVMIKRNVEENEEFKEFREMQVCLIIYGIRSELTNLTVNYSMDETK